MGNGSNSTRLARAIEAWNRGDLDGYLELYDPRIRLHGYSPEPMDKGSVKGFYQMIHAAFPGSTLTIDEEISDGDRMALRATQTGVHRGEFMGFPATGKPFTMSVHTVLHFRDGRVVERWSTADMLGLLVQIGAVPPPG